MARWRRRRLRRRAPRPRRRRSSRQRRSRSRSCRSRCAAASARRARAIGSLNIEADGTIHEVIPKDRVLGTAPPEVIDALRVEVEQADYLKIRSRPFTGTCPIAFDGQETIYTFHVTTGDREIASCKVAIDPADPLFVAVDAALKFGPPGS